MNTKRRGETVFEFIRQSKDAPLVVILLEDAGALLGLLIALTALTCAYFFNIPWLDGAASVVIGLLLAFAAIVLAIETKALLLGEAASPKVQAGLKAIIAQDSRILGSRPIKLLPLRPEM
jgi:divalent metal cation (Fe/Co/Zn/Cd) transporter